MTRSTLAAAGGAAITLGALIAAIEAITRPTAPITTPDINPEALAGQLEAWARDLRQHSTDAIAPILWLDDDDLCWLDRLADTYPA